MVWEKKEEFKKYAEGVKEFQVFHVGDPQETQKGSYRTWKLNFIEDGEVQQIWINVFGASKILEAIGFEEKENVNGEKGFEWEPEECEGKKFKALLTYKKSKDGYKDFPNLSMFEKVASSSEAEIPF